jgi:hypothetical protein
MHLLASPRLCDPFSEGDLDLDLDYWRQNLISLFFGNPLETPPRSSTLLPGEHWYLAGAGHGGGLKSGLAHRLNLESS